MARAQMKLVKKGEKWRDKDEKDHTRSGEKGRSLHVFGRPGTSIPNPLPSSPPPAAASARPARRRAADPPLHSVSQHHIPHELLHPMPCELLHFTYPSSRNEEDGDLKFFLNPNCFSSDACCCAALPQPLLLLLNAKCCLTFINSTTTCCSLTT